tara:strand:- start:59 stop:265 length:207 start_codon:yes stop_codon:yes gene_type:complete
MSSQITEKVTLVPAHAQKTFEVGNKVTVVGGPHTGKRGTIRDCAEKVFVVLDNGVHVHGNYTLFKKKG